MIVFGNELYRYQELSEANDADKALIMNTSGRYCITHIQEASLDLVRSAFDEIKNQQTKGSCARNICDVSIHVREKCDCCISQIDWLHKVIKHAK